LARFQNRILFLFVIFFCSVSPIFGAQDNTFTGSVTDAQGAALVGATVVATVTESGLSEVVLTDENGTFRFQALRSGVYTLTVQMTGFRSEVLKEISVIGDQAKPVQIVLQVAPFSQTVDVVGIAPLPGSGLSEAQVPTSVFTFGPEDFENNQTISLADTIHERLGSVTLDNTTTNPFQPTLRFRGFTASSLLGLPQGVAVYQNGVRINEPFGDTVQFDLMPQFAVSHAQLSAGAEPVFGLNALGGSLAIRLKNGFDTVGFRGEVSGGSFDRLTTTAEWGGNRGPWAIYLGATRFDEEGWRVASPSEVIQAVADISYRQGPVDAGLTATFADSRLTGNAPAPIELLESSRNAVFTYPDATENRLGFVQGRYNRVLSPEWSLQANGYYRDVDRQTLNGDEADFSICDDDFLPYGAPENTLCFGGDDDDDDDDMFESDIDNEGVEDEDEDAETAPQSLVDINSGQFITTDDAEGDAAFNRSSTRMKGYGAAVQAVASTEIGGRQNHFTLGSAFDAAEISFSNNSEVGTLTEERTVVGSGRFTGLFGQAPDDLFNTSIDVANMMVGLYFHNTLSLTDRVHATVAGRFNHAQVDIADRLGVSLNGEHDFSRFNVSAGLVYQFGDSVSVFGRYAESSRVPTAAELSCADPEEPCRVPNAFISDPPLEQAVARSGEFGVRGRIGNNPNQNTTWSLTFYNTEVSDDILFIASPYLIGTGYFQNAGSTLRRGLDFDIRGQVERLNWFASYSLLQATFNSPLNFPSDSEINSAANAASMLEVGPGDRLPGIPRHSFKTGVQYRLTSAWNLAADVVSASSRVYIGDESNDQAQLSGYTITNIRSVYRLSDHVEFFARIDNLFDLSYGTFGVLAELEVFLREVPDADDPRFISPGTPRSAFAGLRVRF